MEEKWCKMQKTKEEMMAFKAAQQEWKKKKERELQEENKKIQEYLYKRALEEQMK